MTAGDRLFVDLLPESWTGEPPGLPREVVEELARRAHEAERLAQQKLAARSSSAGFPPVRVRVASQPTFTRYIFELPELTGVTAERGKDRLTLSFAKRAAVRSGGRQARARPKAVEAIDASGSGDTAEVQFKFSQQVDIRTFREDSELRRRRESDRRQAARRPLAGRATARSPAIAAPRDGAGTVAGQARAERGRRRPRRAPPPPCPRSPPTSAGAAAAAAAPQPAPRRSARRAARSQPPGRPPSCAGRATICGCSFRSPRRRPRRCSSAPIRCGWCSTPRPCSTSACSATTRARPSAAPRCRARTTRRWCASSSNGRVSSASSRRSPAGSSRSATRWRARPSRSSSPATSSAPAAPASPSRSTSRSQAHWLSDPDIGDKLLVITGLGPARGLIKSQDFVDFRALATRAGHRRPAVRRRSQGRAVGRQGASWRGRAA